MARLNIDTGTLGNSATGDTLRTAMTKINTNFIEVYDDLAASSLGGLFTNNETNGDVKIQPNGTGIVEVDQLQINNDAITSLITNSDLTLSGNGTGGVVALGDLTAGQLVTNSITSRGSNANVTIEPQGTGDILLKAGGQVGIGDVGSPDTSLHIKQANAIITLQRTSDANTPGIDFQSAGGNTRAQIYMDGTNGVNKEIIFKVRDDSSTDERFRVTKSGANVTGTFLLKDDSDSTLGDATISMAENKITALRSNDNLEISASGTGEIIMSSSVLLKAETPFVKIQRTDNANVPGIDFIGQAGTSGAKILFDGTDGTANELIFQTFSVSGGLAESFRAQQGGAKVTGALTVTGATTMTDALTVTSVTTNDITSNGSNADITIEPQGTGSVNVNAILTLPDGSASDNYAGFGDADDLKIFHNGSHSIIRETGTGSLYLQSDGNVILGKDTGSEFFVRGIADGAVELYHDNVKKFETTSGGVLVTGTLDIDSLNLLDNKITTDSNANLELTPGGTGTIVMPGITVDDNEIQANRSNDDLVLSASGTGSITAQSSFTFNAGYIEKINTLTSSSTITVDCSLASIHKVTLATNTEFNITSLPTGGSVTLIITQDGSGSRTASFGSDTSTAIKFPGGAPTLSTGAADIDVVTIVNDGTNFLGNCAKNYS